MKNGRDHTRRNRNIGTRWSGHGQDNKHVIPRLHADRVYYETLSEAKERHIVVGRFQIPIIVEKTREDCIHLLSIDDLQDILLTLPREALEELRVIVLRQPSRREEVLHPVWARVAFDADVGGFAGPAIFLDAHPQNNTMLWPKRLALESQAELKRLQRDGHHVEETKRSYRITWTPRSCRRTILRSLVHEVGHLVDFTATIQESSEEQGGKWSSKPTDEKERFAHRYADAAMEREDVKRIRDAPPFVSPKMLEVYELDASDFVLEDQPNA